MSRFDSLRRSAARLHPARLCAVLAPPSAYAVTLLAATEITTHQPPPRREAWLAWASTDLTNLAAHPLGCLVTSAFVTTDYALLWAVLAVLGLGTTAARLGTRRTALLAGAVHVLATLVSQGVVALRIHTGALPGDARRMLDVGPSYVVVGALVAGVAFGAPRTARLACAAVLVVLVPSLLDGLIALDVAALGHAATITLALVAGTLLIAWWPPAARRAAT